MSRHYTKLPEGLVTSDAVHASRHAGRRLRSLRASGIILAVVVVAGAGLYTYNSFRSKSAPDHAVQSSVQHKRGLLYPTPTVASAQAELQAAGTSQEKAAAYDDLGTAYLNNHQSSEAITAYQNALSSDSSRQIAVLTELASAYYASGQRSQAIATLQKLVTLLQQSHDPALQGQAPKFQQVIERLQAGKSL